MMNRIDITQHCEMVGNTIISHSDTTQVTAGKTIMLLIPYWYVKYHRGDKPDVVLFSNPTDWLDYMESLSPIDRWAIGDPNDSFGADNPIFARMQYLTQAVENGQQFEWLEMRIWADRHTKSGRFQYGFAKGGRQKIFNSKVSWRGAIKQYLWQWVEKEGVTDEKTA